MSLTHVCSSVLSETACQVTVKWFRIITLLCCVVIAYFVMTPVCIVALRFFVQHTCTSSYAAKFM